MDSKIKAYLNKEKQLRQATIEHQSIEKCLDCNKPAMHIMTVFQEEDIIISGICDEHLQLSFDHMHDTDLPYMVVKKVVE